MALLVYIAAALGYLVSLACYRIYFHRISHIPGPKLAAFTYWWQSYYDLWPHSGRTLWKIAELHEQFGPIVRIGPNEVHVKDPDFYSEMYPPGNRRREKSKLWFWMDGWSPFSSKVGGLPGKSKTYLSKPELKATSAADKKPDSGFGTLAHDRHRIRRGALAPFFSKQRIRELEPMIKGEVALLRSKLLDRSETGEVLNLQRVYAALSLDIISQHALGESWGALERPDMGGAIVDTIQMLLVLHPFGRAFPLFSRQLEGLVMWMASLQDGTQDYDSVAGYMHYMKKTVAKVFAHAAGEEKPDASGETPLIEKIIRESPLPESEKSLYRMAAETNVLIGAGTDTTARTLAIAHYQILSRPEVHSRLLAEIRTVIPSPGAPIPPLEALERLPYLAGLVLESLRTANSAPARLSRIAPDEDLKYGEYVIPRGTTFGQSNWFLHTDPGCFPDPQSFDPDRWSSPDAERQRRYLAPFGRGARMCLGMNLAYAEIYITLAVLVSDVEMEVFETTERDITMDHEHFTAMYPKDSKGIRARVLGGMKR